MIPLEGKKYLKVPGYEKMVEFGILTSFAYPVIESGNSSILHLKLNQNSRKSQF